MCVPNRGPDVLFWEASCVKLRRLWVMGPVFFFAE
jgi:hypothetical protein